jgi:hypothetical protein
MRDFKFMMACTMDYAGAGTANALKTRRYTSQKYDSQAPFTLGAGFVLSNSFELYGNGFGC